MTNITNGGRTPVAGVVHAIVLLLIFPIPDAAHQPDTYGMPGGSADSGQLQHERMAHRTCHIQEPKSDISVLVVTFLLTVIFDLTIAIEIGLLLAIILFLRRVTENTQIRVYSEQLDVAEGTEASAHEVLDILPGVSVYEIEGPFFFGVATKFDELMRDGFGGVGQGDKP